MPTISGHIGESISFNVQNAGSVTGVFFGNGEGSFDITNNYYVKARVPDNANWDYVYFHKQDGTAAYTYEGTGYKQTGALEDLTSELVLSGALGVCTSGSVGYSNLYEASGICILSATGDTQTGASGKLYSAYGSGLCGNDTDGYTNRGYSASSTRLSNFSTFQSPAGDWLALGEAQDTGDFVYQKASTQVLCPAPRVEQTSYKFVPIPKFIYFTPLEAVENSGVGILGQAFVGITGATISGVNINSFQIIDNSTISGTIPAGNFDNKIVLYAKSGVTVESDLAFKTFYGTSLQTVEPEALSLFTTQIERVRGFTGTGVMYGRNISGLTTGYLLDEDADKIDLLSDSNFSYSSESLQVPLSGLGEGVYDIFIQNPSGVATVFNCISIKDGPSITNSYASFYESALINVPDEFNSALEASANLAGAEWTFDLSKDADKICLLFNNTSIVEGNTKLKLERVLGEDYSSDRTYTFQGLGGSEETSRTAALAQYAGLNQSVCKITSSGVEQNITYPTFVNSTLVTGSLTGIMEDHPTVVGLRNQSLQGFDAHADNNPHLSCGISGYIYTSGVVESTGYAEVYLSHASYSTGTNATNILQQLTAYPDYEIISWEHTGIDLREPHFYASGISWPYPSNLISDTSSEPWENILHSGLGVLSSDDGGLANLSSGYNPVDSETTTSTGSFVVTGATLTNAYGLIDDIQLTGFSRCETGNLNVSKLLIIEPSARAYTGYFWGYC